MIRNQFCHLEHADLLSAIEDSFQILISIDKGFVLRVLQATLANVIPELLGQLRSWQWFVPYDFC